MVDICTSLAEPPQKRSRSSQYTREGLAARRRQQDCARYGARKACRTHEEAVVRQTERRHAVVQSLLSQETDVLAAARREADQLHVWQSRSTDTANLQTVEETAIWRIADQLCVSQPPSTGTIEEPAARREGHRLCISQCRSTETVEATAARREVDRLRTSRARAEETAREAPVKREKDQRQTAAAKGR